MKKDIIDSKEKLHEWLSYELKRYGKWGGKLVFEIGEKAILQKHSVLLRKTEYYLNTGKRFRATLYKIRLLKLQDKYGLHIPLNCCGKGLKIMHTGSVLINENAVVGDNCVFHINTALVAVKPNNTAPIIEDGCTFFVGSIVVGGIHVASHTVVGANSVVNKSIEKSNTTVAGIPAKTITERGSLMWPENNYTSNIGKLR